MTVRIVRIAAADEARYGPRLVALERGIRYPLGADRFEIDHGVDPFRFFRRLGDPRSFAALEGETVVGVLTAVARRVPSLNGGSRTVYYVCDLKAAGAPPGATGPSRVLRPLADALEASLPRDAAAYGVSMNPAHGENRLARIVPRLFPGVSAAAELVLYSLDAAEAARAAPILAARHGGRPTWTSLAGVKDIVLESTGRPIPLLHAQLGSLAAADGHAAPIPGSVHMLCAPREDALIPRLADIGLRPGASATVLARGMAGTTFDFVLTSDI